MMYCFDPIGIVHSCFKDKFGVPRQPGLVLGAQGELELFPPYDRQEAVAGLEGFSHIWVSFVFHQSLDQDRADKKRLTVRPPRLGGSQRRGVFASRSTHRPNAIGLSVVKLERITDRNGGKLLQVSGLDMIEGTPILDIKPYLPYADCIVEASGGYAHAAPSEGLEVRFSPEAEQQCQHWSEQWPGLAALIESVLSLDPRPLYLRQPGGRNFGVALYNLNIRWHNREQGVAEVFEIVSTVE